MKKLYSILSFFALSLIGIPTITAAPLTPKQALARALKSDGPCRVMPTGSAGEKAPVYTASYQGVSGAYVFNLKDGGFVIAAADDVAAPVLAYSSEGSFSAEDMPENLRWWLDEYAREIAYASSRNVASYIGSRAEDLKAVQPLVKTRWDQGSPYNKYTPVVNDTQTPTGCVATALAQLMKFHSLSTPAKGSVSYLMNGKDFKMDFEGLKFDWANMTDRYSAESTEAQIEAVATLMKACGYAVESTYEPSATSASVYLWAPALIKYFGYAPSTQPLNRIYYNLHDWEMIIHESLANGMPVLYSGLGATLGHAFICDGYSEKGYFHFNWGWSGLSDGYYLLSALDPPALGTGGGSGGFNSGQIAVVNARGNFDGSVMTPYMGISEGTLITYSNVSKNFSLNGALINLSNAPLTAKFGFEVEDASGNKYFAGENNSASQLAVSAQVSTYARRLSVTLADGQYKVYPAFAIADGENYVWHRALVAANMLPYWTLTIAGGKGTLESQQQNLGVKVTDFKPVSDIYSGTRFNVTAKITNESGMEFIDNIYINISNKEGKQIFRSEANPVDIPVGETLDFNAFSDLRNISSGEIYLTLQVESKYDKGVFTDISEKVLANVLPRPAEIELKATEFYVENADAVQTDDIRLNMNISCVKGFYANPVRIWCREKGSTGSWGQMMLTPFIYLKEGESINTVYSFSYPLGIPGKTYEVISNYLNTESQAWLGTCDFTVADLSGINDIANEKAEVVYYNIQGIRVENPGPGMYIRRQGNKITKVIIR